MNKFNEEIFWFLPTHIGGYFNDRENPTAACALGAGHLALSPASVAVTHGPIHQLPIKARKAIVRLNDGFYHLNGQHIGQNIRKTYDKEGIKYRHIKGNPIKARQVLYKLLIKKGLVKENKEFVKA